MNFKGIVRRTDLYLRTKYPEVITTIYNIDENSFSIKCENTDDDFSKFKDDFDNNIRIIGAFVEVVQDAPEKFIEVVPSILDTEIAQDFEGIPHSKATLLNLLISKFPHIYFLKIEDEDGKLTIHTAKFKKREQNSTTYYFLNSGDRGKIEKFLNNLKLPIEFSITEEEVEESQVLETFSNLNPITFIYAASFKRNFVPEFSLRDEALWFDNIDKVFKGEYNKKDLFFYDKNEYSCYVDYSVFDNIDIRNHLFLFQTVYLTLPFEKNIENWLLKNKITKNEFLELVKRNRIKVLLTQPEYRYDSGFIQEVYEVNPNAVATRRALATLQQIDIIEMSNQYILNDLTVIKELKKFSEIIGDVTKIKSKSIYDFLIWPIRSRRNSFEKLNHSGLFSTASFGVNTVIEKQISEIIKKDLTFEFTTSASSIHLANSLNATYFPFKAQDGYSDSFYANMMGEMLNFYKSANSNSIKSFIDNKKQITSGIMPISPIDIIEINDYISITELEAVLSKDTVNPHSKRLMESLSELSNEDRIKKIDHYNVEVNKKINKQNKSKGSIDLAQNILMDVAGAISGFSAIGSIFSLAKLGSQKFSTSIPAVKNITEKIEEAMHSDTDQANIHFLTKINRVAKLK